MNYDVGIMVIASVLAVLVFIAWISENLNPDITTHRDLSGHDGDY